jgi:hypothetical protein
VGRIPDPWRAFDARVRGRPVDSLVLAHGRRQLLWLEITQHPTAEWLARQITEAFPWASAPAYLVRDNTGPMGRFSPRGSGPWVFATGRSPRRHPGRMALRNA